MLGSTTGSVRERVALACCGLLGIAILACAATTGTQSGPKADTIADVRVERDGDATVLTLVGLDHPVFTAFQQSDPERLVVDLAAVRPDPESDQVAVDDELVTQVAWSPFATGLGDPMTRVEVSLVEAARYDVIPTEEGLEIRLWAEGATGVTAGADDPWAIEPLEAESEALQAVSEEPDDGWGAADAAEAGRPMPVPDASELAAAGPATALVGLDARAAGAGAVVELRANGVLDAESFTLEDPDRLVIDLPGVSNQVENGSVEVGSAHVRRVRVGTHEDRVRVVVDAGEAENPFDGRRMIPVATGLVVALGSGVAVEDAVVEALDGDAQMAGGAPQGDATLAAAPVPIEELGTPDASGPGEGSGAAADAGMQPVPDEPVADGQPVTIYGVEYDAQDERDRVVVLGERPFDYLVYEPDPETVVISIEKAVMDPEVGGRITPEPGGPVSLVTAFEQPDVETSEVRVVVKRAPDLAPQVSRRGSLLLVDFARSGGVAGTPPVLAAASGAGEAALPAELASGTGAVPAPAPAGKVMAAVGRDPAPPASLEPPAAIGILEEGGLFDGKEYTGRRISLDFKDVEIADVLRLIAEVSDLNVIAGDEVNGRVTIRLVDVPWDQALDVILLTKSLGFMRVGNVLRVAPSEVIKQEEELRLQERRAKEKLEDLVVKLQPVNYANVKDIEKMVKKLLSPRGSVNIDQRTNTLILKDIPSVIDEATALVKAIDTQTPQVMIEAKIVEANLDFSREFGAVWSFGAQPLVNGFDPGSGARTDLGNDAFRLNTTSTFGNNAQFINPITAAPTALFNLAGFVLDDKLNLDLQLQAAEINGDGKVISSPRVVTLDNSKAEIEQGVSIPFQTFENGDAQLEFVDAVLKLEVTPHITADRSIIMEIGVSRNAPDDSVFTATGSPAIAKNEVETETLVKDGQTLVLGGIYVVDKSARQSRVPYLHRIPLLGAAFRSDEISDSRKELLIFVTPHIVVVPQVAS